MPRGVDRPLSPTSQSSDHDQPQQHRRPLLFRNQTVLDATERAVYHDTNVWAAYLDGCSVVLNHADAVSPWLAALCDDLQQHAFPHAYANTYLTPPGAQTAPPHADDRDVLVIQVVGAKQWTVYSNIPIPFPYPHEQVGKEGLAVPPHVLEGPKTLNQVTLEAGDVLYIPRGQVHQAQAAATTQEPSFHVTIALATHDWTLAGMLSQTIVPRALLSHVPLRQAVDWRGCLLQRAFLFL